MMFNTLPGATYDWDAIRTIVRGMHTKQSIVIRQMQAVLDRYDGDYVVPLPSLEGEPKLPPMTPALVAEAIDWISSRAASVEPTVTSPAINRHARSQTRAQLRRRIIQATYYQSKWKLARRRYYKQISAYGTTSLAVYPDFEMKLPRIEIRSPLATFSEEQAYEELRPPHYVAFIVRRSGADLRAAYPHLRAEVDGPITAVGQENMWETFEWNDEEQTVFGLLGPTFTGQHVARASNGSFVSPERMLCNAFPNRAGCQPAIIPHNVSLGRIGSRIGQMLGQIDLMARLQALDIIAQEKAIFPDMYIVGNEGQRPMIVNGRWEDGRTGVMNELQDVAQIGAFRTTPDQRTAQTIDRMERNVRISTNLVPQAGGETYGALRTGRGIDSLAGMAIDPRVQELHEISEEWLPHMNHVILQTYKGWWGRKQFSMYSGWSGDMELVEFVPNEDIETTATAVSYTIPGADVVQQTQILGSMYGAKVISRESFRNRHPWIKDPEHEKDIVNREELEDALKQSILQQLIQGQIPLPVSTLIHKHLKAGKDIFEAVEKADEEIRARQATEAPAPPEGMVAPPEAQPGLAAGPGALQQPLPLPSGDVQVPQGTARVRQLMAAMAGGAA